MTQQILQWNGPTGPAPTLPKPQSGKTQTRFTKVELKKLMENIAIEAPEAFKPANLVGAKEPATKLYRPDFSHKPDIEATLAKLYPDLDDPVKQIFERPVVTNSTQWPWCTVGKVFAGKNDNYVSPLWTGSGTVVGAVNLLLTAGHVVPWDQPGWWMRFVPAYDNSAEPFGSSYVSDVYGYNPNDTVKPDDYAVGKLYTPLGNSVGYMGAQAWSNDGNYTDNSWISVGYPGAILNAQVPIVDSNIVVTNVQDDGDSKLLEDTFFGYPGWSGGPMWNWLEEQPRVVAVMSGYDYTSDGTPIDSLEAAGIDMLNLLIWAIKNWQ
jgi:V8-like Glu-specific endopeptidase